MKKWIIIATLILSPGLRAQSSFGQVDPSCFRLKVQIGEKEFTDYLHIIESTGSGLGPHPGRVKARLIVPTAQGASTTTSEFRFHPWGGIYSFNMPFAIYENGKFLQFTLQGTYQIPFTTKEKLQFGGHFVLSEEVSYPFTAEKISDSATQCGPSFDSNEP